MPDFNEAAPRLGAGGGTWRLVVRGQGVGYLKYFVGDELRFECELNPRLVRLIRLLSDARRSDAASAAGTGGWRLRAEIGDLIGHETDWDLPPATISSYFSTIRRLVKKAWAGADEGRTPPALLESGYGRGWRIPPQVIIAFEEVFAPERDDLGEPIPSIRR